MAAFFFPLGLFALLVAGGGAFSRQGSIVDEVLRFPAGHLASVGAIAEPVQDAELETSEGGR